MSERVAAVVLAGGLGTRLRSVLPDLPKPMAPVAGRPFVEWVLRYLSAQGVRDVVISTGYRAEVFATHFAAHPVPGLQTVRCVAEPEPLGTAGGFVFAARTSGLHPDAWLVLNGDSIVLTDLAPFLHVKADAALLALRVDDAERYGSLEISDDDHLLSFREKQPGAGWINAGVYLLRDAALAAIPQHRPLSWETELFPQLIGKGHDVAAIRTRGDFIDIGLPETLEEANAFVRRHADWFVAGELPDGPEIHA